GPTAPSRHREGRRARTASTRSVYAAARRARRAGHRLPHRRSRGRDPLAEPRVIVVPDAGPLIYLGGAAELDLLRKLYQEVVVPRIVYDEVVVAGAGLPGAQEVAAAGWLRV